MHGVACKRVMVTAESGALQHTATTRALDNLHRLCVMLVPVLRASTTFLDAPVLQWCNGGTTVDPACTLLLVWLVCHRPSRGITWERQHGVTGGVTAAAGGVTAAVTAGVTPAWPQAGHRARVHGVRTDVPRQRHNCR